MIVPCTAAVSLKINFARLQGGFVQTPRTPPGYGPAELRVLALLQVLSHFSRNSLDSPSDPRCANTAAWNVFANFQGDGVSSKRENCAQRPCCQKLHVSSIVVRSKFCVVALLQIILTPP